MENGVSNKSTSTEVPASREYDRQQELAILQSVRTMQFSLFLQMNSLSQESRMWISDQLVKTAQWLLEPKNAVPTN